MIFGDGVDLIGLDIHPSRCYETRDARDARTGRTVPHRTARAVMFPVLSCLVNLSLSLSLPTSHSQPLNLSSSHPHSQSSIINLSTSQPLNVSLSLPPNQPLNQSPIVQRRGGGIYHSGWGRPARTGTGTGRRGTARGRGGAARGIPLHTPESRLIPAP